VLVKVVWGDALTQDDSYNFLFSHIKNIKGKLTSGGAELSIRTVYGVGYQLLEYAEPIISNETS
jgi:DNA-binding winged helix-turn-helix (wHTH) protein